MNFNVTEAVRRRRSVRTYNGKPLTSEDRQKLEDFIAGLKNPFGVQIEYRFLDAKRDGLSSPVIVGTDAYLGAKVPNVPNYEIAFGYDFERVVLYAQSLGIGTVWIAGTFDRPAFEKAMEVKETEIMPAVTPIGYPAEKMSVREAVMRKGVKADVRLPFEELFFNEDFSSPLSEDDAGVFCHALRLVRLAPSAVNKQPWRIVVSGNTAHFYEKRSRGMSDRKFDVQRVDIGIALAHFVLALEETGAKGTFISNDPKLRHNDDTEYVISYVIDEQ